MLKRILNLFRRSKKQQTQPVTTEPKEQIYVTLDWAGYPITTKGDGYILSRKAEMLFNGKYYPTGEIGEYPCDPETGKKLPIVPYESATIFVRTPFKFGNQDKSK